MLGVKRMNMVDDNKAYERQYVNKTLVIKAETKGGAGGVLRQ